MRFTILAAILVSGLTVIAQPIITQNNVFRQGDVHKLVLADATNLDPGPEGNNRTWDFTNISPTGETTTFVYGDPAQTPFAATFPQANLVETQESDGVVLYAYYRLDASGLSFLGSQNEDFKLTYTDVDTTITFPFTIGSVSLDNNVGQFEAEGILTNRVGTSDLRADAYGTIRVPGRTFENTLRIKTVQVLDDTANVQGFSVTTKTTVTSYVWWSPDVFGPVMLIAEATVESQGFTETARSAWYRNLGDDIPDPTQTRIASHVTRNGGGFKTDVYVKNQTSQNATVTLQPWDSNGNALTETTINLSGDGHQRLGQDEVFNGDVSHFTIDADQDVTVSTGYKVAQGLGATAHLHESSRIGRSFRVYPGERDVVFDGMAAVNNGISPAKITGTMLDEEGQVVSSATLVESLAVGAKFLQVFDAVFPNTPNGVIQIESTQNISVLFLRGSRLGTEPAYLYATEPQTVTDSVRYIPHVTRAGGGFQTTMLFDNQSDSFEAALLTLFNSNGDTIGGVPIALAPGQRFIASQEDLFGDLEVSHITVEDGSGIVITAAYKSTVGTGATAHVNAVERTGTKFEVYPGERDVIFDGMAIVNLGDSPATITGEVVRADGSTTASQTLVSGLAPNAKFLAVFDGLFPDEDNVIIRIESTQPSTVIFLRGSPVGADPAFLYSNDPLPE